MAESFYPGGQNTNMAAAQTSYADKAPADKEHETLLAKLASKRRKKLGP